MESSGLPVTCGWCKKLRLNDTWILAAPFVSEDGAAMPVAHDICPTCARESSFPVPAGPDAASNEPEATWW
jgi:hypothetical protein